MGSVKRAMEEDETGKMIPEFSQETREDKMTKMAVMKRELERLKEELENQLEHQRGRNFNSQVSVQARKPG